MGDFRGLYGNQTKPCGNEEKFLECFQNSFLTQHVLLPTRGDNILDLVMSNEQGLVKNIMVGKPFGSSDHCVIKWDMVIKKIRNKNCNSILMWIMHS